MRAGRLRYASLILIANRHAPNHCVRDHLGHDRVILAWNLRRHRRVFFRIDRRDLVRIHCEATHRDSIRRVVWGDVAHHRRRVVLDGSRVYRRLLRSSVDGHPVVLGGVGVRWTIHHVDRVLNATRALAWIHFEHPISHASACCLARSSLCVIRAHRVGDDRRRHCVLNRPVLNRCVLNRHVLILLDRVHVHLVRDHRGVVVPGGSR